jgi:hypothetical protein
MLSLISVNTSQVWTRHTYDKEKAKIFLEGIPDFLTNVRFLLEQLNMRAGP